MAERYRNLSEFTTRLRREGNGGVPFSWLLGAGMSASAGIPLAKEVSKRIILFEYIMETGAEIRPWKSSSDEPISYSEDLNVFLDWYEERGSNDKEAFEVLQRSSIEWLGSRPSSRDISLDAPQCYPRLFEEFLLSTNLHHRFLTSIVRRSTVVNLAHLGLAGLMRDYPGWGQTAFTTNFDDLLLKATLTLNHTARVFGELDSQDAPVLVPSYPQIVYLHGRHTGYRLANTRAQLNESSKKLEEGFREHLRNSSLIVVGYSGWEDMAMRVLEEWPNNPSMLKGNLYWVQYKDELIDRVKDFLESCPPSRAVIVADENLTADSFMLAMCNAINSGKNREGFGQYRQEIISLAKEQHRFTLEQLSEYPRFDPGQAVKIATEALRKCVARRFSEAESLIVEAKALARAEDLSGAIRGQAYLRVGLAERLARNLASAEKSLRDALDFWDLPSEHAVRYRAANMRALADVIWQMGKVDSAKALLKESCELSLRSADLLGFIWAKKSLAEIALLEGKEFTARWRLDEVTQTECKMPPLLVAEIHRVSADTFRAQKKYEEARKNYEYALSYFTELGDDLSIARVFVGLSDLNLVGSPDLDEALRLLDEAAVIFNRYEDLGGSARVEQGRGDVLRQKGDIQKALIHYEASHSMYVRGGSLFGRCNCETDMLVCRSLLSGSKAGLTGEAVRLKHLAQELHSGYTWEMLIDLKMIDPKTEGNLPW